MRLPEANIVACLPSHTKETTLASLPSDGTEPLGQNPQSVLSRMSPRAAPKQLSLTSREREVLRLIADGCASKQIAAVLKISINTVNNHRAAVFLKLNVHSATAAAKRYWETLVSS